MDRHPEFEKRFGDFDDVLAGSENMEFGDEFELDVAGYGDCLVAVETYYHLVGGVVGGGDAAVVLHGVNDVARYGLEETVVVMIQPLLHDSRAVYCCYEYFLVHTPTLDHSLT